MVWREYVLEGFCTEVSADWEKESKWDRGRHVGLGIQRPGFWFQLSYVLAMQLQPVPSLTWAKKKEKKDWVSVF